MGKAGAPAKSGQGRRSKTETSVAPPGVAEFMEVYDAAREQMEKAHAYVQVLRPRLVYSMSAGKVD